MGAQVLNHDYSVSLYLVRRNFAAKNPATNFLLIVFLSLTTISSTAQTKFKVFDSKSGLSSARVTSIVQDQTGYLWIGTTNGLNRFDGNSFKIYRYNAHDKNSILVNAINCLAVDELNRIWMGHESGVTCYDQSANRFTRYHIGAKENGITFISFDKYDRVWIGSDGSGLVVLNPETGVVEKRIDLRPFINKNYTLGIVLIRNVVNGMMEDAFDRVWLATQDGLYVYDRKLSTVKPVRVVKDIPGKHRDDYFSEVLDDDRGGLWLAAYGGGICHYTPDKNRFEVFSFDSKDYNVDLGRSFTNKVRDIAWKNESELWVTTEDRGKPLGIFNVKTKAFSFLKLTDIFGDDVSKADLRFTDIFVDRSGIVWIASRLGLVMINPRNSWDFEPKFKTDSISICAIVEDTIVQKKFLATTFGRGLVVSGINDNHVRSFKGRFFPSNKWGQYVRNLLNTSGDSLWVISRDNIRLFDKIQEKWIDVPQLEKIEKELEPQTQSFKKMIRSTSGDYWISTLSNGAFLLRGSNLSLVKFEPNPDDENSISSKRLMDLREDRFGRIWFATLNAGISIFDPAENSFRRLSNKGKDASFLPANAIYEMDMDHDGNLWLATGEVGIVKIELVNKDSLNIVTFDSDALSSECDEVKIDDAGRVWFRSPPGVSVLDPETMNVKYLAPKYGMLNVDFGLLKSNGHVLVNGSSGYGLVDEKDLFPDTTLSPLVINSIKVFGSEIHPKGANQDSINLTPEQNSFSIDFAAIDFLNSHKIKYSYRLVGLEGSEWSAPSGNKSTEFTHLAGGDYIFKLRATNQEGAWSKEGTLLYIHIETPFWETTWFYLTLALVCIGIIALIYFFQISRIKAREKEQSDTSKRISQLQLKALHTQMRPHFIFNCLSAISGHIVKFETVKASEFLSQFSRLMRGILENSTESWITLEQEIETLKLYLAMEGLRFEERLSYTLEVEEGIYPSTILIPSMIVQPYVENAIGHGLLHKEHGPARVSIRFLRGEGNLKCVIEDNGIGRQRSGQIQSSLITRHRSLGLQITSERLELLQGSAVADIQDLKNELGEATGTRIIIMLVTRKLE